MPFASFARRFRQYASKVLFARFGLVRSRFRSKRFSQTFVSILQALFDFIEVRNLARINVCERARDGLNLMLAVVKTCSFFFSQPHRNVPPSKIESVDAEKMEVIFGREFKLEAADPYLFFAYRFRDLSLVTRLIVSLGYGFGDAHINKMLTQSLRADPERRLLAIQRCDEKDCDRKANEI